MDGPAWLVRELLVPVSWGRLFETVSPLVVNGYRSPYSRSFDGVMGLKKGAAEVVTVIEEVTVMAYAADLYSDEVSALWIDRREVLEYARLSATRWYVIGEDTRSGLVAGSPENLARSAVGFLYVALRVQDAVEYPMLSLARLWRSTRIVTRPVTTISPRRSRQLLIASQSLWRWGNGLPPCPPSVSIYMVVLGAARTRGVRTTEVSRPSDS